MIDLLIGKIKKQPGRKIQGRQGQQEMFQNVAGIQEMIAVGPVAVFPGTAKKNGGEEKGDFGINRRRPGDGPAEEGKIIPAAQWGQSLKGDGKMIQPVLQSLHVAEGPIDFGRVQGPGRGRGPVIKIAARVPGLGGQAVGQQE